jgi:hypothetical protein
LIFLDRALFFFAALPGLLGPGTLEMNDISAT